MMEAKHSKLISLLLAAFMMMAVLTGCAGSFSVVGNDDNSIEVTAENADADNTGTVGPLTVEAGQKVVIEPNLEEGKILVQFAAYDESLGEDADFEDLEGLEPVSETEASGTAQMSFDLAPGKYMVTVSVTEKANGSAIIKLSE